MTREEQIKEAAIEFSKRICSIRPELNVDSFTQGAEWADKNPDGSIIKWQTGLPKERGTYLVTLLSGEVRLTEFYKCKVAGKEFWDCVPYNIETVIAWCKLSDIKSYKEEEK